MNIWLQKIFLHLLIDFSFFLHFEGGHILVKLTASVISCDILYTFGFNFLSQTLVNKQCGI